MLIKTDLDGPVRLRYWPIVPDLYESARWQDARCFSSVREAVRAAVTERCPQGKAADVLTASGVALRPNELPEI